MGTLCKKPGSRSRAGMMSISAANRARPACSGNRRGMPASGRSTKSTRKPMADSRQPGIPLIVERLVFGGAGIGRLGNGKICFVRQVLPGERVKVRLHTERGSYVEAELEEIIEASPDRVAPGCLVYGQCGGCHYQHISYPLQLVIKGDQVREVLRRMGGVSDPPVEPVLPSPLQYGYRNRITVHSKSGRTGF